jgi:uncharacterized membrane protein
VLEALDHGTKDVPIRDDAQGCRVRRAAPGRAPSGTHRWMSSARGGRIAAPAGGFTSGRVVLLRRGHPGPMGQSERHPRERILPRERSPSPERILSARRLLLAVAAGVLAVVVAGVLGAPELAPLVGWTVAAAAALIWVWMISWPLDHQGTKGLAEAESRSRSTDAAVLLAAIASLAATALALVRASSNQDPVAITQVVLSVLAVTLSWALVNTDRRCRARSWARRHGTPRAARRPRHTGAQRAAPGRRRRRGLRRLPGAGARPGGVVRVPLVRPSTHPGRVTRRSIRRRLGSAGGRSSGTAPLPARTPHTSWCREPQPRTRACSTGTAPPRAGW